MVRHDVEPHIADIRVRTGEDGKVIDGEHGHVVESHELCVLNLHGECQDAEAVITEPEHCIPEHEAHDSRLHRGEGSLDVVAGTVIRMEREGEGGHPLHVARERRQRRDETLKAVDHNHAVVEEIRLRDLHASDEDLRGGAGAGVRMDRVRGDGYATAWTQGLDLGAKSKSPEILDGEEAGNDVLAEEVGDGAREASAEGGVGGSEDGGRTGPCGGSGGCSVGERRSRCCELVETEMRQDWRKERGVREERVFMKILWSWRWC